jgi:putative transposase
MNPRSNYHPSIHHRRSIRLKGYDTTQAGAYFVTMVAWQRECLFGEVVDGVMRLSPIGKMVQAEWRQIPRHFPHTHLETFVVMPNHAHGIVVIDDAVEGGDGGATRNEPDGDRDGVDGGPEEAWDGEGRATLQITRPNGPTAGSLGAMIGLWKSRATKRIWRLPGIGRHPIWQRNYYEHIIRSEAEFRRIWKYIDGNPIEWEKDQLYPKTPPNPFNQDV